MSKLKERLLRHSNYGIQIFARILREYYPDQTVLTLRGRECLPTRNPFHGGRRTLSISVVDDHHTAFQDLEVPQFSGDVFDFARKHYGVEGEALHRLLVKELNIPTPNVSVQEHVNPVESTLRNRRYSFTPPKFSYFRQPISNTTPLSTVSLVEIYKCIRNGLYQRATEQLRSINDSKAKRAYKANKFDYVTFSGQFSKRSENALIKHSGLLAIDFDNIDDPPALRQKLITDEHIRTELLFISPSGNGIKWIISIDLGKADHATYFQGIMNYIHTTYGLEIDKSGKDISRACFLPHDPNAFVNPKYLE